MKRMTFAVVALLATGSIGLACAAPVELLTNGDFSDATHSYAGPAQISDYGGNQCGFGSFGGQFVNGWTAGNYAIWYGSASAASSTQACTRFGNTGNQLLPSAVSAPPSGPGSFVGLDGEPSYRASIAQMVGGLTAGNKYTVSFDWASTQEMSRTGPTTEQFQVSMFGTSFLTSINSLGTHGWSGWSHESFTFTATSGSSLLEFLSIGTPGGYPPFALLGNVSMVQAVPEPPELALFGGGLLGLGVLTIVARRRALRRRGAGADLDFD